MPIYDFICQACGSEFEKLVSFSDESAVICPSCQSVEVQRQMGLPAIHFKGSGWYITDSKDSKKNGRATSNKPAEDTSSTNGDKSASSEESSSGSADSKEATESQGKQDASGESKKATVT